MYKVSGNGRYFGAKGRYCEILQLYWADSQRKGTRLGRYTPGSFLPREILGRYQVAIGRDFVDYEHIGRTFLQKKIYTKKADLATARRGRHTRASTSLRVPISLRFYRETAKSLQEFLIGMCIMSQSAYESVKLNRVQRISILTENTIVETSSKCSKLKKLLKLLRIYYRQRSYNPSLQV